MLQQANGYSTPHLAWPLERKHLGSHEPTYPPLIPRTYPAPAARLVLHPGLASQKTMLACSLVG